MFERDRKQLSDRRICTDTALTITLLVQMVVNRSKRSKREYRRSIRCMKKKIKEMKMTSWRTSLKKRWRRSLKILICSQEMNVVIDGRGRMVRDLMEKLTSSGR